MNLKLTLISLGTILLPISYFASEVIFFDDIQCVGNSGEYGAETKCPFT